MYKETTTGFSLNDNSFNDYATVEDDGIEIFFNCSVMFQGGIIDKSIFSKRTSSKDVAKYFWGRLIRYLEK